MPMADHGLGVFFPYGLDDRCMALSMHLFTLATQVRGVSDEIQYGTAVVLIGLVLVVNSASIGSAGVPADAEEMVVERREPAHRDSRTSDASTYGAEAWRCGTVSLEIPREADLRRSSVRPTPARRLC